MGNDNDGRIAQTADHPLKPVDRIEIEVIRRLVQKKNIRLRKKRLFKNPAPAFAARKRIKFIVPGDVGRNSLRDVNGFKIVRSDDLARIRLKLACHHFHQCRLAFAVAARKRGSQAAVDRKGYVLQNARPAKGERDVLHRHQKVAHQKCLTSGLKPSASSRVICANAITMSLSPTLPL